MPRREVIKLKKADLDRAIIRGLHRTIQKNQPVRSLKEQVHLTPKLKKPKHKKRFVDLEEEF